MLLSVQFRILILLSLITVSGVYGQNQSRIDSLKSNLQYSSGQERFKLLNDLGFEFRLSNPDSTIYYCKQAYQLGKELNLPKELSKPLSFIGLANAYKGDFKTSFDYHNQAIEVAAQQEDSVQLAFSYNNFGRLFFDQGDIPRAYDNLLKSLQLFEQLNDLTGLAYVYRSLSNLYKSQQDYSKALQASKKAYELRAQLKEQRALLSSLMELGSVYSLLHDTTNANESFERADSISILINDPISGAEIQIEWAEFLLSLNDTDKAFDRINRAYLLVKNTSNVRLLPKASLLMGQVYYQLNEFNQAKNYLNQVIEFTEQRYLDLQRDAYYYLSKIYEHEGKQTESTSAFNKYLILKESLQNVQLARQIEKLQFQLEIEKVERENEALKNAKAQNDATIRQQQLEKFILGVLIVFVVALFLMQWRNTVKRRKANAYLARQNHEIEMQRKEIAEKNEHLEKRNQELSEINYEKDTLMNIVAHDLKSPLNRIKGLTDLIVMENQLNPNQDKYLALIRDSTRSGLDLITDLLDVNALEVNREPDYSYFDLSLLVKERIQAFQHYASTKSISIQSDFAFADLVFLDQSYVVRVLDNLISNAIKFSPSATIIWISVTTQSGYCCIQVKDEGPGFYPEDLKHVFQKFKKLSARPTAGESPNGLGLAIVKILVERLGGKIELETEPGKGSAFNVLFPIKNSIRTA